MSFKNICLLGSVMTAMYCGTLISLAFHMIGFAAWFITLLIIVFVVVFAPLFFTMLYNEGLRHLENSKLNYSFTEKCYVLSSDFLEKDMPLLKTNHNTDVPFHHQWNSDITGTEEE